MAIPTTVRCSRAHREGRADSRAGTRPIDQVQLASHVILNFGTDTQKSQYLPRIRTVEDIWCQLFSEPDCGSDLAGIKARAELRSDDVGPKRPEDVDH